MSAISSSSAESNDSSQLPPGAFKVGIILPLSGDGASVGEAIKNGMMLGWERLPQTARDQLSLVFEDDALSPQNAISAFRKLTGKQDISILANAGSASAKALAPLADRAHIPFIAIATDPEVVRNKTHTVNFWVTAEEEARVALEESLRRGYRRIARITTIHDCTNSIKDAFDKANHGQLDIVLDEEYPSSVRDFRTYIAKLRSIQNVDAIFVLLYPGQTGVFAKQVRQQGVALPLFSAEFFEDAAEVKSSAGALVDQWYVNTDDPDQLFLDQFRRRFPNSSLYGASNGHDLIMLLGAAVLQSTNREQINQFLHSVKNFSGVLGTYSASGDNRFTLPAAVKIVTTDGFRKLR